MNYVLMDLEWFKPRSGKVYPTQIACLRVDSNWNATSSFHKLIRPKQKGFAQWDHISLSGAERNDFLNADSGIDVFKLLEQWIQPDDIICWWTYNESSVFAHQCRILLKHELLNETKIIKNDFLLFIEQEDRDKRSAYDFAVSYGIPVPEIQHCSWNDVLTMQRLLRSVDMPISVSDTVLENIESIRLQLDSKNYEEAQIDKAKVILNQISCPERIAYQRYQTAIAERAAAYDSARNSKERKDRLVLASTDYAFWASKGYSCFHVRTCQKLARLNNLIGFATYQHAIRKGYQPCHECKPTPKLNSAISMSFNTKDIEDEKIEDVLSICSSLNIEYLYKEPYLYINTKVAEWVVHTKRKPITLCHRPAVEDVYHRQHRMFMSVIDSLNYILNHDGIKKVDPR